MPTAIPSPSWTPPPAAAAETLDASLSPAALPGSTPNSLAVSPDETKLSVANAGNNNVAVFDVASAATPGRSALFRSGSYPTSVRVTPDGRRLLVASAGPDLQSQPQRPAAGKKRRAYTSPSQIYFPAL